MNVLEKFKEQLKEHKRLGVILQEKGQSIFEEASREIFKKYPNLNSFSWTQYTPHFNDGDPCHFGINDTIYLNGISQYNDDCDEWNNIADDPNTITDEVYDLISSVDEDSMKLYGEGKITVSKDGRIVCDYYSHD